MLARNRIWGNIIGGSVRSGYKELAKPMKGPAVYSWYSQSNLKDIYPFIKDWEKINTTKQKYEERKLRIFMRGIKIGTRKEGKMKESMDIFAQAKQKQDETTAKEALKGAKDSQIGM
jgi:Mitochondrial ribosomal subunit S27